MQRGNSPNDLGIPESVNWREFTNQSQWKTYLTYMLKTNPKFLIRALLIIDSYQEPYEKALSETIYHNGVGWTAIDAELMQHCVTLVQCKGPEYLTKREWCILCNKIPKYWKQLMNYSKKRLQNERMKTHELYFNIYI